MASEAVEAAAVDEMVTAQETEKEVTEEVVMRVSRPQEAVPPQHE